MSTIFNQNFNVVLLPQFGTSGPFDSGCLESVSNDTSVFNGGFTTPTEYSFEGTIQSVSFTTPKKGQPIHLEIELQNYKSTPLPERIVWNIITQNISFPGLDKWFSIKIDGNKSQLNGASTTGSIDCKVSKDAIAYNIKGKFGSQPTMPPMFFVAPNPPQITCKLYVGTSLSLFQQYSQTQMFVYLFQVTQPSVSPILGLTFASGRYVGFCDINTLTVPSAVTSLQGTITISDTSSTPLVNVLSLNFNAFVDTLTQVEGALTSGSTLFNKMLTYAYVRGALDEDALALNILNGDVLYLSNYTIPTLSSSFSGNITLTVS